MFSILSRAFPPKGAFPPIFVMSVKIGPIPCRVDGCINIKIRCAPKSSALDRRLQCRVEKAWLRIKILCQHGAIM